MTSAKASSERFEELTRIRDEELRRRGIARGEAAQGVGNIIIRFNPEDRERQAHLLQWGLVPHWAEDRASPLINARAETVAELASFRESFARRRCLIPSSWFIERKNVGQPRGKEYAFGRPDGRALTMAGIWDAWRDPETGEWLRTYAMITTEPNELVGAVHDRMPAILVQEQFAAWLGEVPATQDELLAMLAPFPSNLLVSWPAKGKRPPPGQTPQPGVLKRAQQPSLL